MHISENMENINSRGDDELEEYKEREFCKSVKCSIQEALEDPLRNDEFWQKHLKNICKTECRRTAWNFHDWLQKQGYKILKEI